MLPTQGDILWTFLTIAFTVFSIFAFINVIQHCREHETISTPKWGGVFGAFVILNFFMTAHMFTLLQAEQMSFISWQVLGIFILLLIWGMFFKNTEVENQSPPAPALRYSAGI